MRAGRESLAVKKTAAPEKRNASSKNVPRIGKQKGGPPAPKSSLGKNAQNSKKPESPEKPETRKKRQEESPESIEHRERSAKESEAKVGGTVGNDEPPVTFSERKFTEDIANPMVDVGESNEQPLMKLLALRGCRFGTYFQCGDEGCLQLWLVLLDIQRDLAI